MNGHKLVMYDRGHPNTRIRPSEFDLQEGFEFTFKEALEQLTDTNDLKKAGVLPFLLPDTDHNRILIEYFWPHNQFDPDLAATGIEIGAFVWGVKLIQDRMFLISRDPKGWKVEIAEAGQHWSERAKAKYLNTIDLGTFTFTKVNIENNQSGNVEYNEDGDLPVHFPFVDHGRFDYEEGLGVTPEYFRPLHSPLGLLRQGFCEIGVAFECPFLETVVGRRYWAYLLAADFYDRIPDNGKTYYGLKVEFDPVSSDWSTLVFGSELSVFTNTITPTWSFHTPIDRDLTVRFHFQGAVQNVSAPGGGTYQWIIHYVEGGSSFVEFWRSPEVTLTGTTPNSEDFFTTSFEIPADKQILITFVRSDTTIIPTFSSAGPPPVGYLIEIDFEDRLIYLGTTFEITAPIHPDYTLWDLFSGIAHAIRGKVKPPGIDGKVVLYTPETAVVDGETIPGFLRRTKGPRDISMNVEPDSVRVSYPQLRANRFLYLKWKDSSDNYIGLQGLPDLEAPHSQVIDLGEAVNPNGIESNENPFFEPTIDREVYEFNSITEGPLLPIMWDNDEGQDSFKIGPRLLFAMGYHKQWNPLGETYATWNYLGADEQEFAIVSQAPTRQYDDPLISSPHLITFANDPIGLFTFGWKQGIDELKIAFIVRLQMWANLDFFTDEDRYRQVYVFKVYGEPFVARLSQIDEFKTGNGRLAKATFVQITEKC